MRRYFKVNHTKADELLAAWHERRDAALDTARELREAIGASEMYQDTGNGLIVAVDFDFPPDPDVYRVIKGHGYYPRKNSKAGREMAKRFDAVPRIAPLRDSGILELFGAKDLHRLNGMTLSRSSLIEVPGVALFLTVPADDATQAELEEKQRNGCGDTNTNSRVALAEWVPPEGLIAVREWEVQKVIDEYNNR